MTSAIKKIRLNFHGLRFIFSLTGILFILMILGLVTAAILFQLRHALLDQMRAQGIALARELADNATEAIATADHLLLSELASKVVQPEKSIRYAAVVDENYKILAHSNYKYEGRIYYLPTKTVRESHAPGEILWYSQGKEKLVDFSMPMVLLGKDPSENKRLGSAHVVYSLQPIHHFVLKTWQMIFWLTPICLGLGIIVALVLVQRILHPLRLLSQATEQIGSGNLDVTISLLRQDELGQLTSSFNQMLIHWQGAQAEQLVQARWQQEQEFARQLHQRLKPTKSPQISGYSFGWLHRPVEEIGGDYFNFIDLGKNNWGLVLADISGQGMPQALVMAQTSRVIHHLASAGLSPSKIISQTNQQLYRDLRENQRENLFVTLSYLALDATKRTVTFSRAGHVAIILYRHAAHNCEFDMPVGIAMGIAETEIFDLMLTENKLRLTPGDFVLLYTDGVDEACNAEQELFGMERVIKTLLKNARFSAQQIIHQLDQAVQAFVGQTTPQDDMTMILVKVEEEIEHE